MYGQRELWADRGVLYDYVDVRTDTRTTNVIYYPATIICVRYQLRVPNHYGYSQGTNTEPICHNPLQSQPIHLSTTDTISHKIQENAYFLD